MIALRRDPHLWIHLVGLASLPLWLDLCLAGLAVGDPVVPPWLEVGLLGLVASGPLLWMQWQRPFYPFSLLLLATRPDSLSPQRLQLLSLQHSWLGKVLASASALVLLGILVKLYPLAPIAAGGTPLAEQPRAVGWLIGTIAFLLANFFLQLAVSALWLLLTPQQTVDRATTYETSRVLQDFTVLGIRLRQVLPEFEDDIDAATELDSIQPKLAEQSPPKFESSVEEATVLKENGAIAPPDNPEISLPTDAAEAMTEGSVDEDHTANSFNVPNFPETSPANDPQAPMPVSHGSSTTATVELMPVGESSDAQVADNAH